MNIVVSPQVDVDALLRDPMGGRTPLMIAALNGDFELIRLFLRRGADLDAVDNFGLNVDALVRVESSDLNGAAADPARLVPMAKDLGVLLKLLHNPVESPDEPKFRKVKLANKRIAAVLGNPGAREVLLAAGFAPDAEGAFLVLPPGDASGPLTRAVEGVTEAQRGLCRPGERLPVGEMRPMASLGTLPGDRGGRASSVGILAIVE